MIKSLWQTISYNLIMVIWFLFPMILCRLADIIFGVITAYKSATVTFDWKKTVKSIFTSFATFIGLMLLVTAAVSLPEIMNSYNINFIDTETLSILINITMVVSLLVATTGTYGKDAFTKLTNLLNGRN